MRSTNLNQGENMFTGSYVALVTPFRNGELDEAALRKLVQFHLEQGTHGLVPVGTTGEAPTLNFEEHKRVVEIVVAEVAGQIPVIAGAGSNNPMEAIELTKHAQTAGADGVLSVAGYYNRPNQEGLYQHFYQLHEQTDIPIIIYNIPPRAIVDVLPETMARLAQLPRVVGVKDATMELGRVSLERQLINKEFSYLSGEDMTALAYNAMGGNGCISVTANVVPGVVAKMQTLSLEGRFSAALELHEKLVALHSALFACPSPAGIKFAVSELGLCTEECRLPIVALPEEQKGVIRNCLKAFY